MLSMPVSPSTPDSISPSPALGAVDVRPSPGSIGYFELTLASSTLKLSHGHPVVSALDPDHFAFDKGPGDLFSS